MCVLSSLSRIFLLTLFCLFLSSCSDDPEPVTETIPRVKYFVVGEQASGQSRQISGKVVAAETSPLSFAVSGTVEEVLVEIGQVVTKGQLLTRLDAEPLRLATEQARAELNIARAKVIETKQAYDRAVQLFERRAASKSEVEVATANHAAARGNARSAESDLERKERDLKNAELTAPFAGTIASRSIQPFQEISTGTEAFVLQSSDAVEVEVSVPETLIRDVDYGQIVQVNFPTFKNIAVNGEVAKIGSRTETGNAFPVSIRLTSNNTDLRPGMTASVTFNFDQYLEGRTAYLIPLSAIAIEYGTLRNMREGAPADPSTDVPVFIVNEKNKIEVKNLVVGDLRGNKIEVFEGLVAGEKIVSAGISFLREGMQVELWTPQQGLKDGT